MRTLRILACLLAILVLPSLVAGEPSNPSPNLEQYKCSLEIPKDSGWVWQPVSEQLKAGHVVAFAGSEDQKSFVLLIVMPGDEIQTFDDKAIAGFKHGMESTIDKSTTSIRFDDAVHITVHGIPGIEIGSTMVPKDEKLAKTYLVNHSLSANGNQYIVQAISTKGAPASDPIQTKILNSFDFVGEPVAPAKPLLPFTDGSKGLDYQLGQIFGTCVMFALVVGLVLWVIRRSRKA